MKFQEETTAIQKTISIGATWPLENCIKFLPLKLNLTHSFTDHRIDYIYDTFLDHPKVTEEDCIRN